MAAMPLDQRKLMIFDFATRHWSELAVMNTRIGGDVSCNR
jgi:hypothetical protein